MQVKIIAGQIRRCGLNAQQVWDTAAACRRLDALGLVASRRMALRRLHDWQMLPPALAPADLVDELGRPCHALVLAAALERARRQRKRVLFVQLWRLPTAELCLHTQDMRGGRCWLPLGGSDEAGLSAEAAMAALQQVQQHMGRPIAVFAHGALAGSLRQARPQEGVTLHPLVCLPTLVLPGAARRRQTVAPHLHRLEAESIHIIREAVAEADNPVMLYSVGKDSSVMLHLARKAFYPAPPPFALLHVDTRWKFQEMYLFRDHMARVSGMELLVHTNPAAIAQDINPFDHGSAVHTDITKTEGLKQALDQHRFDVVFGGARRDEEKSRAKERIFSLRSPTHRWDPKQQRPELWQLYNTRRKAGESIRVFPLSNWTELDIWQYIHQEDIAVVPLYFARERPVVVRDGMILMVDDARFRLLPGEQIVEKRVRFRTLGCYPLTGALESSAASVPEIVLELMGARHSERQGRAIDRDASASMEKKKQEGYF